MNDQLRKAAMPREPIVVDESEYSEEMQLHKRIFYSYQLFNESALQKFSIESSRRITSSFHGQWAM